MHYAAGQVNYELCKLLIKAAPEMLHVADKHGCTPLVYVVNAAEAEGCFSQEAVAIIK